MTSSSRITMPILLSIMAATPIAVAAQDDGPPPVLVVNREFLKPGRGGTIHEKTEAAYLAAAKANKSTFHYFALTSMTGPDRALFIGAYPSFAAMEAENKVGEKNPALGAATDHAMVADGDLLASTDASNWLHRPELSLNEGPLTGARYMEIFQVIVKPGHGKEFDEWSKMYVAGFKKVPGANWAVYQQIYGTNSNAYLFITLVKSLSEIDAEYGPSGDAFEKALGESGMKKLRALESECVETEMTNIFRINPKMSLPEPNMVKAEPDFWTPKPAPAAKKPAPKPAPAP